MKWSEFFTSSVGKKLVMALTGLFLITFLVVHVGINACIWALDDGETFNKAAHFMGTMILIRIMEVGLFIIFIIHMECTDALLAFANKELISISMSGTWEDPAGA